MFDRQRRRSSSFATAATGLGLCCCLLAAIHFSGVDGDDHPKSMSRTKRGVPFLQGSGNGYIIAIALPIGSGRRHVFTAFNFELHFGLPDNSTFSPTALKTRWEGKRSIADDERPAEMPTENEPRVKRKSKKNMFTRKNVYRVIEHQLFESGFNGTSCLLKTICNTAESDLYENNGVFGNLFHIVFTPSSSKDERLPQFFYDAEHSGHAGQCEQFRSKCPKSLLEYVSRGLELFE